MHHLMIQTFCTTDGQSKIRSAVVDLDDAAITRIRQLAKVAKQLGVLCIEEYDPSPKWYASASSKAPMTAPMMLLAVDSPLLVVQADSFYWTCSERGTGIQIESEWTDSAVLPVAPPVFRSGGAEIIPMRAQAR